MNFKKVLAILLALAMVLSMAACTKEEEATEETEEVKDDFPNDTITFYTMNAGSTADNLARAVGAALSTKLGVTIIYENKGGAGGLNEVNAVLSQEANGYTIGTLNSAMFCTTCYTSSCTYKLEDMEVLCQLTEQPQCVVCAADAPYNNYAEWAEYVKTHENYKMGVQGATSMMGIAALELQAETGLPFATVSWDKTPEMLSEIMGGHLDCAHVDYSNAASSVEGGKLKILFFTTEVKAVGFEDVESVKDLGLSTRGVSFQGIFVKTGTPDNRVQILVDAIDEVMKDEAVIKQLDDLGMYYEGGYKSMEAAKEFVQTNHDSVGEVLKSTGLIDQL